MKFDILNRWSGKVQFSAEIECGEDTPTSVKLGLAIKVAVKDGASLDGASLDGASLDGASLDGASLVRASLDGARLVRASLDGASLDGASLVRASLDGASLDGASLDGASLDGASLDGASLDGAKNLEKAIWDDEGLMVCTIPPIFFTGRTWPVMFSDAHIKIGCQVHATAEWRSFTDEQIARMDGTSARRFWKQWKTAILALADAHQSKVKSSPKSDATTEAA